MGKNTLKICLNLGVVLLSCLPTVALATEASEHQIGDYKDLMDLLALAETNDYTLQIAKDTYTAQATSVSLARSALLPEIALQAGLEQTTTDQSTTSDNDFVVAQLADTETDTETLALSFSMPLLDLSAAHTVRASKASRQVAALELAYAEQEFLVRVANSYLQTLNNTRLVEASKAREGAIRKQFEQVSERHRVGLATKNDVEEAQAALDVAAADTISVEVNRKVSLDALYTLTGHEIDDLVPICDAYTPVQSEDINTQELISVALDHNLMLQSMRESARASKSRLKSAKAARLPRITLGATVSDSSTDQTRGDETFDVNTDRDNISLNVTVPLWSGGAIKSTVNRRQAEQQAAHKTVLATERQVRVAISTLSDQLSAQYILLAARKQAQLSAQLAYDAAQIGYDTGTRNIVELVQAASNLYQSQAQYNQARIQLFNIELNMKLTLGTLTVSDLQAINDVLTKYDSRGRKLPCQNSQK